VGRLRKARPVHGPARARPRLRGGRRLPRERRPSSRASGRITVVPGRPTTARSSAARSRVRRRAHGARAVGRAAVRVGHGAGGARLRARAGRAPGLLVRLAHHARRQDVYSGLPVRGRRRRWLARSVAAGRRARRSGRGLPPHLRQRRAWTVVRGSDLEEGESQGCRCGAATSATPCSPATGHAASTSRSSWSRPDQPGARPRGARDRRLPHRLGPRPRHRGATRPLPPATARRSTHRTPATSCSAAPRAAQP
jgi:hypothetical protein